MNRATREEWYLAAAKRIEQHIFKPAGYELPKLRIGCGWPTRNRIKMIGQCFGKDSSKDKTYEIFVSPKLSNPVKILSAIVHELCHTIAGVAAQHKKPFITVMKAVGMVKKWTECNAGDDLLEKLIKIQERLGDYPHAELSLKQRATQKQNTRLLKVACPKCGYTARVTRKWLDALGPPICPADKVPFVEEIKE